MSIFAVACCGTFCSRKLTRLTTRLVLFSYSRAASASSRSDTGSYFLPQLPQNLWPSGTISPHSSQILGRSPSCWSAESGSGCGTEIRPFLVVTCGSSLRSSTACRWLLLSNMESGMDRPMSRASASFCTSSRIQSSRRLGAGVETVDLGMSGAACCTADFITDEAFWPVGVPQYWQNLKLSSLLLPHFEQIIRYSVCLNQVGPDRIITHYC